MAMQLAISMLTLHCTGCGRRLLQYEALGASTVIVVRCRDCKAMTELRAVANAQAMRTALAAYHKEA